MGRLRKERLARFLGYDPEQLVEIASALHQTLDEAWQEDRRAYDFGEGTTYSPSMLGGLLRGKKGLYEILYIFGDDADETTARLLFDRTAAMLSALLESDDAIRDWGVPDRLAFTEDGVQPASDTIDTAEQWDLVNHLTDGFTLVREEEETAQFFTRLQPELLDTLGAFTDRLLVRALDYQMPAGRLVRTLDLETGEITSHDHTAVAIGRFITAAGNAYRQGSAFERAQDWDNVSAEVQQRSRDLYDAILSHTELLETAFLEPDE